MLTGDSLYYLMGGDSIISGFPILVDGWRWYSIWIFYIRWWVEIV